MPKRIRGRLSAAMFEPGRQSPAGRRVVILSAEARTRVEASANKFRSAKSSTIFYRGVRPTFQKKSGAGSRYSAQFGRFMKAAGSFLSFGAASAASRSINSFE